MFSISKLWNAIRILFHERILRLHPKQPLYKSRVELCAWVVNRMSCDIFHYNGTLTFAATTLIRCAFKQSHFHQTFRLFGLIPSSTISLACFHARSFFRLSNHDPPPLVIAINSGGFDLRRSRFNSCSNPITINFDGTRKVTNAIVRNILVFYSFGSRSESVLTNNI